MRRARLGDEIRKPMAWSDAVLYRVPDLGVLPQAEAVGPVGHDRGQLGEQPSSVGDAGVKGVWSWGARGLSMSRMRPAGTDLNRSRVLTRQVAHPAKGEGRKE